MKAKRFLIMNVAIISSLSVLLITANIVISVFHNAINLALSGSGANYQSATAQEAYDKGAEVGRQIEEEGLVLLKNNNGVLPLENTEKINLFGWASSSVFYGGSGSGTSNSLSALGLPEALKKKGIECNPSLVSKYEEFQS